MLKGLLKKKDEIEEQRASNQKPLSIKGTIETVVSNDIDNIEDIEGEDKETFLDNQQISFFNLICHIMKSISIIRCIL